MAIIGLADQPGAVHSSNGSTVEIDPLSDPRWDRFLRVNPRASVFHSSAWLEAVYRTYGYRPVALTTFSPGQELVSGLVFCRVRSWLTGKRLVSIPFSDHCEPLYKGSDDLQALLTALEERRRVEGCDYAELRPVSLLPVNSPHWRPTDRFYLHKLDLRPGARVVFGQTHRDCIQRRIRHAEKSAIKITRGRDADTLKKFYGLMVETRRRHGLLPQPISWFRNVLQYLGDAAVIHLASKDGQPVAAIFTLQFEKTLYYKYAASAERFHTLGAMPFLIWNAIQMAIDAGLDELDLGRSDFNGQSLITFKERWNAVGSLIYYWRTPGSPVSSSNNAAWMRRLLPVTCKYAPSDCLAALGALTYRHFA